MDEPKSEPRYKWKPIVATATKVGDVKGEAVLKINVPIEEDAKVLVDAAKRIDREDREERDKRDKEEKVREKKEREKEEREKEERERKDIEKKEREKEENNKKNKEERDRLAKVAEETKTHANKVATGTIIGTAGSTSSTGTDYIVKDVKDSTVDKNKKKGDRKMEEYEIEQKVDSLVSKRLSQMDIQKTIKDIGMSSAQTEKKVMAIEESLGSINETLKGLIAHEKEVEDGIVGGIGDAKNDIDKYGKESVEKIDRVNQRVESLEKRIPEKVLCSGDKGCNAEIEVGSSVCPNCARPIEEWPDMPDWVPYSERKNK